MFQSIKDQLILCFDFFKAVPFAFLFVIFLLVFIFFIGFFVSLCVVKKSAKNERKDAINRSRAVLSGQMLEQVAPFLPDFPCNPADVRFVGKPIDFVAFPGAVDNKPISEVLFIEVKSGTSALSEREKEIKNAIQKGRVKYIEYRIE
jgi:predicted Holliday junction resolvase-like endonuclease